MEAPSFGILAIAVSSTHQKVGIGKMLMQYVESESIKCGFNRMHLTFNPQNQNAIRFYENLNRNKSSKGEVWKGTMVKEL